MLRAKNCMILLDDEDFARRQQWRWRWWCDCCCCCCCCCSVLLPLLLVLPVILESIWEEMFQHWRYSCVLKASMTISDNVRFTFTEGYIMYQLSACSDCCDQCDSAIAIAHLTASCLYSSAKRRQVCNMLLLSTRFTNKNKIWESAFFAYTVVVHLDVHAGRIPPGH